MIFITLRSSRRKRMVGDHSWQVRSDTSLVFICIPLRSSNNKMSEKKGVWGGSGACLLYGDISTMP